MYSVTQGEKKHSQSSQHNPPTFLLFNASGYVAELMCSAYAEQIMASGYVTHGCFPGDSEWTCNPSASSVEDIKKISNSLRVCTPTVRWH